MSKPKDIDKNYVWIVVVDQGIHPPTFQQVGRSHKTRDLARRSQAHFSRPELYHVLKVPKQDRRSI